MSLSLPSHRRSSTIFGFFGRLPLLNLLVPRGKWKKHEVPVLFRSDALVRIVADLMLVNGSMLAATLGWLLIRGGTVTHASVVDITGDRLSVPGYVLLWSFMAITVFHWNGFYTRTRGYASRYKLLVIVRAVTILAVLFAAVDRLVLVGGFSRAVIAIAWLGLLISVATARLAKDSLLSTYRIEPRSRSNDKVKRILVVGGAGYIGSMLIPRLLRGGYHVRVLDSFMYGNASLDNVKHHPAFESMKGDIREIQPVVDAMKDCDAVIDLAAIVGDPACEENRQLAVEVNRAATHMLIDIAKGYGIRRFLFASSCSVYGASEFLMDEYSQVSPISTYAQTKVDSENLLVMAADSSFHPTILRFGTLFGLSPRPRLDLVVNLLTAQAAITGKITIFNGKQWRPFLHVDDAGRAFIACLEATPDVVSGEVFNVGDYRLNHQLREISERVAQVVPHVDAIYLENADKRNYRVSFDKIHSRLGFRCEKTIDDGIREMYQWIKATNLTDVSAVQFNNQAMTRAFAQTPEAQRSTFRVLETLARSA
jgi:nucleoside-diphosphate-sugar epimerase